MDSGQTSKGVRIARQSPFSYAMFALGTSVAAFSSVQGGNNFFGIVVGLGLGLTGLVSAERFGVEEVQPEEKNLETAATNAAVVGMFAAIALVLFAIFDWLVPRVVFTQSVLTYTAFWGQFSVPLNAPATAVGGISVPSWFPSFDFLVVFIPNMEEQFFRGLWGNLALRYVGGTLGGFAYMAGGFVSAGAALFISVLLASIPGGLIFGGFHTPAYNGSLPTLVALSADGTLIIALNSLVGRMDVGIIAHMGNNGLSFALQQSTILNLLPNLPPTPIHMIAPIVLPAILLSIAIYKRRSAIGIA